MRAYNQWVLWRLELKPGVEKPTKVPYSPWIGGGKASVTNPQTWGGFDQACLAPMTCLEAVPMGTPIDQTGYSGIGFVFTPADPFTGIDFDDCHGDEEAFRHQIEIYRAFQSYSERSPSGTGLHIITKGTLPTGRRRSTVEIYDRERYFTMTGNVLQPEYPIVERQDLLTLLWEKMGGDKAQTYDITDQPETLSDDEVVARAAGAVNGEKFSQLWAGNWQGQYPSQSEADLALVDIIAFYSKNMQQIRRLFRASALGQTPKDNYQHRGDRYAYVEYMVKKSFDRQLPPIDIDGFRIAWQAEQLARSKANETAGTETGLGTLPAVSLATGASSTGAIGSSSHSPLEPSRPFPPGLLGEVAQYILDAAPRPVPEIALAGAIGMLAGICGRSYNVSGTGLNQYILLLAQTGTGKDAITNGINKLTGAVKKSVPSVVDFKGPGELASAPGLIKWLANKHCVYCILGEFGKKIKQMASPTANAHEIGLSRILLQMYSKSGHRQAFDPMAYSDQTKNTVEIPSPSLTIVGESVPEAFYEMLDEGMISDGLLPRFMLFEYTGKREYLQEGTEYVEPPFGTVQAVADLTAYCLTLSSQANVLNIPMDAEATEKFREFERWTTDKINETQSDAIRHLWNRAHLKAMKLAALQAVGMNYTAPVIHLTECMWATDIVVGQIVKLIAKFETGMVGSVGGSEAKQLGEVIRCVATYMSSPYDRYKQYGGTEEMHRQGVVTEAHISRRLIAMAAFRQDRIGSTGAIKRAIKTLLEADELREVPPAQMQAAYGTKPRAFVVANPARFIIDEG